MKLSDYAKLMGVSYRTAHRWFAANKIPHRVEQLSTGTIIVHVEDKKVNTRVYVYTRVSTYERKDCLDGQASRCVQFANSIGLSVDKVVKEIASGMNDKRKKLMDMLDDSPTHIIVENKDRLTRFGFNYIEKLLNKQGCTVLVLNKDDNDEHDLLRDFVSVITSFCCRLYGLRRGKSKTKEITGLIKCPTTSSNHRNIFLPNQTTVRKLPLPLS